MSPSTLTLPYTSKPAGPSAFERVLLWWSGILGLVRVEVRGAAALAAGLGLFAVIGLAAARFAFSVPLPSEGPEHLALVTALALSAAFVLTAQLMEADWRDGTARALQVAPARPVQVLTAKLCGGLALVGCVWLLIAAIDSALVLAFPQGLAEDSVTAVFEWSGLSGLTFWLGWLGLTATAVAAIVVRHALVATMIGGLVGIAPLISSLAATGPGDGARPPMSVSWGVAIAATLASLLFIAVLYSLRGRRTRNVWRRGSLAAAMLLTIPSAPAAMVVGARVFASAPTFSDPDAWVAFSYTSIHPDNGSFTLQMSHGGHLDQRISTWKIDSKTLEATRLPSPVDELHPLTAPTFVTYGATWSWDGKSVLGTLQRSSEHHEHFSIDVASGAVTTVARREFNAALNHAGWTFERLPPSADRLHPGVRASRIGSTADSLVIACQRNPIVPSLAPHLLFYTRENGEVYRLDTESGEDAPLGLINQKGQMMRTSPTGRWIVVYAGGDKRILHDTASGRQALLNMNQFQPLDGKWPILEVVHRGESRWRRLNLDSEEVFETEVPITDLKRIAPGRYLGHDHSSQQLHIFDHQGRLVETLR